MASEVGEHLALLEKLAEQIRTGANQLTTAALSIEETSEAIRSAVEAADNTALRSAEKASVPVVPPRPALPPLPVEDGGAASELVIAVRPEQFVPDDRILRIIQPSDIDPLDAKLFQHWRAGQGRTSTMSSNLRAPGDVALTVSHFTGALGQPSAATQLAER